MYKLTNNYGNDVFPDYLLMTANAVPGDYYVPFTGTKDEYGVYTNLTLDPSADFDKGEPYFGYIQGAYENGISYYNGITGADYDYEGPVKVYTDEYYPKFNFKPDYVEHRHSVVELNVLSRMPAVMYKLEYDSSLGVFDVYYPGDKDLAYGASMHRDAYEIPYTTGLVKADSMELLSVSSDEEGELWRIAHKSAPEGFNFVPTPMYYAIIK